MSALVHAILHLVRDADPQWVDRPQPSTTTSADFLIATAANQPSGMDGFVFDTYPKGTTTTTSATAATALATAAAKATAAAIAIGSPKAEDGENGECRLLGSFALFVQLALGALALLSLVYKRWRERPQRPVKIWFFDASKQVFGSVLVHAANVFMSMLTSGRFTIKVDPTTVSTATMLFRRMSGTNGNDDEYMPNPCSFYLLNLAIDTTLGIPILILLLRIFTALAARTSLGQPAESIQSGNYGSPPRAWWWLKQSLLYFCGLFGMKFCVLIIFLMLPWISRVGDWALQWTEGNEKLQIVFVMMLFPLIMNAMQYYIIDSFIKKQTSKEETEGQSRPGSEGGPTYQIIPDDSVQSLGDGHQDHLGDDEMNIKKGQPVARSGSQTPVHDEYDPEVDGDRTRSTVVGSSSSGHAEGTISTKLFPKE